MKINLEINAPTPEEFGELIFTLLHTVYGVDPDAVTHQWHLLHVAKTAPVSDEDREAGEVYDHYVQVGATIREMQLGYYKAGAEAGMHAAQMAGPIESQN